MPTKSIAKPLVDVLVATTLWGFGFVATVWALRFLDTPAVIFFRFLIATCVGFIYIYITDQKIAWKSNEFKYSLPAGVLIGITLVLQTWGLVFTTPTKSAFVTTLYVVLVPVIHSVLRRKWPDVPHLIFVAISLIGSAFIVELTTAPLNWGDLLTFLNAITAAIHIIYVEHSLKKVDRFFSFNVYQSFWALLFTLTLLPFTQSLNLLRLDGKAWIGLLFLSLGSTLIAFFLQVRAQKQLPSQLASLLFLLESPISFVFSFLLLGETLSNQQILGGALIILACAGAVVLSTRPPRAHPG